MTATVNTLYKTGLKADKVWDKDDTAGTDYITSPRKSNCADYINKLVLSNGEKRPDPHAIPDHEWVLGMSKWPSVIWPDIYTNLIEKPRVYTKENLRVYKSLDAYNYVLCGRV